MFNKLVIWAQGRHTLFAGAFFVVGNFLQWFHRLDGTWIAFMTSLMGFVLGHSMQENHFKNGGDSKDGSNGSTSN